MTRLAVQPVPVAPARRASDRRPVNTQVAAVPSDFIWRMGLDKYHEMIRAGVLTDDDPVELLEGWLVYKMPKHRGHTRATQRVRSALERNLPAGWHVDSQEPVTLRDSEPEPDVAVIRGEPDVYPTSHPAARALALLVEVADSTLDRDRGWKRQIYARSRVPSYWIVNLVDRQIEVYASPSGTKSPDYRTCDVYDETQHIPLLVAGRQVASIAVRDLLP